MAVISMGNQRRSPETSVRKLTLFVVPQKLAMCGFDSLKCPYALRSLMIRVVETALMRLSASGRSSSISSRQIRANSVRRSWSSLVIWAKSDFTQKYFRSSGGSRLFSQVVL